MLKQPSVIWGLVVIQVACGSYFLWEVLASVLGLPTFPLRWQTREFVEIGASLGLILGTFLGVHYARSASKDTAQAAAIHRLTSMEFKAVVQDYFDDLGLTRPESETGWHLLKGLSMAEIANSRGTNIAKVKTHCTAIYRKAGVSGKRQLFSTLIQNVLQ